MTNSKEEVGELPPSIELSLAIGGDGDAEVVVVGEAKRVKMRRRSEFTLAQLNEFEQQRIICKYIAAGLPPPLELVYPIWKSVAASFVNAAAFYYQFPSFRGFRGFDFGSKMDADPGRCRRTDGKKWRCSRDVVRDEKYCETHMNRGRSRSRKPVENVKDTSPSNTELPKISEEELENSKTDPQIPTPKGLQFMAQSSNKGSSVSHSPTTLSSAYRESPKNIGTVAYATSTPLYRTATTPTAAASSTTAGRMISTPSTCVDNNPWLDMKNYGSYHAGNYGIIRGRRNNINIGRNFSPGSGFSPRSVLQGGQMILVNCNGLYFDNRSGKELEPGRCRRTDGKKWRCKKDVLPGQKYCDRHVHRGVKQARTSNHVAGASSSATAMNALPSQTTTIPGQTHNAFPKTNLTMSIPARSPATQIEEQSNSNSDSDATITDTSLAAYEQLS